MGIVVFAIVIIVGVFFLVMYNALVAEQVGVDNAWAQIDVQLKRRHSLIPNLVESVKGYMEHEKDTLEKVIKARSQAVDASSQADKEQSENMLTGALKSLMMVVEQYPQIKADRNVATLMEELTSTENKIAYARKYYNDSVAQYNIKIRQYPAKIVADMAAFRIKDMFKIDEVEKADPKVSF